MQLADLPTRRTEEWKYSDLRLALRDVALPQGEVGAQAPAGPIERLAALQGRSESIDIPAGRPQVLIERFDDAGDLYAHARRFRVHAGASLTRVVLQRGPGVVLSAAHIVLAQGARFQQMTLAEGGRLVRIETHVAAEGADAHVELNGVYLCAEARHADLTSVIEHKAVGGTTRQLVKGAVRAGGRGVFQGKILVDRGAQKTDARQHHQALLLEEGAQAFAKPELIINADDVQCAHGNTIGAVDEAALFYMRQRGLPEKEARALLAEGFLLEAMPEHLDAPLRDELAGRIAAWLRSAA